LCPCGIVGPLPSNCPVKIMTTQIFLNVELTGSQRSVTSNKNPNSPRTFYILSAYAELPGHKYPQDLEIFIADPAHLKPAGTYSVPLVASVKDNRCHFELDFSVARPVSKAA